MEVRFKPLKATVIRGAPGWGRAMPCLGTEQRDFTSYDSTDCRDSPLFPAAHRLGASRVSPHCCSFIVKYGPASWHGRVQWLEVTFMHAHLPTPGGRGYAKCTRVYARCIYI